MKLLSYGEIIWDIYGANERTLGGAPLNFAAYTALFDNTVWLASSVGDDALGIKALEQIKALGIKTEYISTIKGKATGQCCVSLDKNRVPTYNILQDVAYDRILLPEKLSEDFDAIAFGTLALREKLNRKNLKTVLENNDFSDIYVDLNLRPPFYGKETVDFCLSYATIVKISDEELPLVTQVLFHAAPDLQEAVASITEQYSRIKLLLITCGAKGAFCYDCRNKKVHDVPSEPAAVQSTVGAGDSFGATFLTLYDKTKDIPYALKQAAKISAFVVAHKEAVPANMENFIKNIPLA